MNQLALCLIVACGLWSAAANSQSYTFTTLAGNAGYGSADGTGSNASFAFPKGVAVDDAGNIYVADYSNNTIRKITPSGVVTTLAGKAGYRGTTDGTGSDARFDTPQSVAVDSAGNVYVAEEDNEIIRKITPNGVVTILAGWPRFAGYSDGSGSNAYFNSPKGIAVDSAGNVYVADTYNNRIRKISPAGVVSTLAGWSYGYADGTGSAAHFAHPEAVAVDKAGNVYVADTVNQTIRKITPARVVSTLAGLAGTSGTADGTGSTARFKDPNGIAVDSAGNVYVADNANHTIRKITPAGVVTTFAGKAGYSGTADGTGSTARFCWPRGLAVDSTGNVYVGDSSSCTIRKITPGALVSTLAGRPGGNGSTDGMGIDARFYNPSGVTVDSAGNLYVADNYNHTIRKITPGAQVTTLAGKAGYSGGTDGVGSSAQFNNPNGITVDSAGNLYVADTSNHTIRKITPGAMVTTFAGRYAIAGSADGTGNTAQFNKPSGVAVDSVGNVYVADNYNHTIRKITPAGVVSTLAGLAGVLGSSDGTGSTARFYNPSAVAVDTMGNLYVADDNNYTIRKITVTGVVSTLAGLTSSRGTTDGAAINARFYNPRGIAVDSANNVYVADSANYTIRKITPAGVVSTLAGLAGVWGSSDGTGTTAWFFYPMGIAVDRAGNLYVADSGNDTIRKGFPTPSLRLSLSAKQFILSWPQSASNYAVEAISAFSANAVWTPLNSPVGTSGGSFVMTNTLDAGACFYRLRAQ